MAQFNGRVFAISLMILAISVVPVYGQITTACSAPTVTSFTPCLNFITGSSGSGTSPTSDCCSTFKAIMDRSMDCACLLITGNVPFQLPINRTLAISLPRACRMSGVPIECKANTGAPLPAPSPFSFGSPSPSPLSSTPSASFTPESEAPESVTLPASPPLDSTTPTAISGRRPVVTPTNAAYTKIPHLSTTSLLFGFVVLLLKY
ncbi:hypothetical protein MKW94_004749 [Papaver nudicaule]|uniref:Bifunctional inhibitor/plant lipid transfer protein/seed storage helical domain-containing protein n=1 Tax=Papaver nudicaule TaxID=74823 RepID=A0AA41V426_PAPNU|nr:hypothetical protein [Papaver nudicaule]